MISVKKDGPIIKFVDEKGKIAKYNLMTNECIGISGRPVKSLQSFFRNRHARNVIESIEQNTYRKWFNFVYQKMGGRYSNMSRILEKLKDYTGYEQVFSMGISFEHGVAEQIVRGKFIPTKACIKLCRNNNLNLSRELQNLVDLLGYNLCQYAIEQEVFVCLKRTDWYGGLYLDKFKRMGYNMKRFIEYLGYLKNLEGINVNNWFLSDFDDHIQNAIKLRNNYDKYPKNFLTTKQIVIKQVEIIKHQVDEEAFKAVIDKHLWKEVKVGQYTFLCPKFSQDIKDEGKALNHCVGGYAKRVVKGTTFIMFMRHINEPDTPLITLEVRNEKVMQARGAYNRSLTESEKAVMNKWEEILTKKKEKTNDLQSV